MKRDVVIRVIVDRPVDIRDGDRLIGTVRVSKVKTGEPGSAQVHFKGFAGMKIDRNAKPARDGGLSDSEGGRGTSPRTAQ